MNLKPLKSLTVRNFYDALDGRYSLLVEDKKYLGNLKKGEAGERLWNEQLKQISADVIIISDLTFKISNTLIQIDSLCIFQKKIVVYEVKYFEGDYFVDKDMWLTSSGIKIRSPLVQVQRLKPLFEQLLSTLNVNIEIEYRIILIHPNFFLYQAPRDPIFIFQPQIPRYIKKINDEQALSHIGAFHKKLAQNLVESSVDSFSLFDKPVYKYSQLKKGIRCAACGEFIAVKGYRNLCCQHCEYHEAIEKGVLRTVNELFMLFPNIRLTTGLIYDWCGKTLPRYTILKLLKRNYNQKGGKKNCYFEEK